MARASAKRAMCWTRPWPTTLSRSLAPGIAIQASASAKAAKIPAPSSRKTRTSSPKWTVNCARRSRSARSKPTFPKFPPPVTPKPRKWSAAARGRRRLAGPDSTLARLIIGNFIKRARLFLFRFCSKLKTRMNIALRATAKLHPRLFLRWLAIFCALCFPVAAQTPASPTTDPAKSAATSLSFHGTVNLEGPWRFQIGDDPRWADPGFDDSAWPTVTLGKPLAEQGIESYAGFGWYRLRLQPQQLSQFDGLSGSQPLDLLLTSYSIGQLSVYINGVESGHARGMA